MRQLTVRFALGLPQPPRGLRLIRLGSTYGGWVVPDILNSSSICYSAGVGEDTTFDLSVIGRFGCPVYAFDPTPKAIEYASTIANQQGLFHFEPWGLWSRDERCKFFAPTNPSHISHSITNLHGTHKYFEAQCFSLESMMTKLNHERLDLLKMDIEGAEYEVLATLVRSAIRPRIICVEFDQPTPLSAIVRAAHSLGREGYKVIAFERWNITFLHSISRSPAQFVH